MIRRTIGSVFVLVALLLSPLFTHHSFVSYAQSESATLSGTVTDTSGAIVSGADVRVVNVDTNVETTTKTNGSGIYFVPDLKPGKYRVFISKDGFRTVSLSDLTLNVQAIVDRNFTLQVGSSSETVTVTANSGININTSDGTVSTVVDRQFIENMPLSGRSFQGLIELAPGVVAAGATGNNPGQFSINGQRTDTNYFTIDGVSAHAGVAVSGAIGTLGSGSAPAVGVTGGFNTLVSVDALQEFRIQTSSFAPEFGRAPGGQISIVTRSGTNQYHGDVFDYLRNNYFDAKDWFADYQHLPHPVVRQNDFGGVFGGPIIKNKLFFFASYEGLRLLQQTPSNGATSNVPSLCYRGTAPTTGPTSCATTGGTPAPAIMQPYLQDFPVPTNGLVPGFPNAGIFAANTPTTTQLDAGSIRVDYQINSRMTVFARYNDAPSFSFAQSPTNTFTTYIPLTTYTAGFVWNIGNTMVNDLRFNYSTSRGHSISSDAGGYMGAIPLPAAAEFLNPAFAGTGDAISLNFVINPNIFGYQVNNDPGNQRTSQTALVDSFSVTKGAHQLKFGVDWRHLRPTFSGMPYRATLTFPDSTADGLVSAVRTVTEPGETYVFNNYSFYGQDTWKLTPKLTITYGLRWDINPAPSSPNSTPPYALTHFDPTNLNATTVAPFVNSSGSPIPVPPVYKTEWNAFGPRVGVAYQLSTDPKWQRVLRAGTGIFYDTADDVSGELFGPYTTAKTTNLTTPTPINLLLSSSQAPLTPASVILTPPFSAHTNMDDPNLRMPHFYQFNVAIEQALGTSQSLTITYVGMIGRNLARSEGYAQVAGTAFANLFPSGITVFRNDGTSNYNALQVVYQRRLSRGLQVLADYTWAHSIDTASAYTAGFNAPSSENPNLDRGPSDFDIRHAIHGAVSYDMPTPWKENRLSSIVLGHWSTDAIYQFRTAQPFDLVANNNNFDPVTGELVRSRPNYNGGPIWLYGNVCTVLGVANSPCAGGKRLNSASFSVPANGVQGNFPRNALRAFALQQLDMTVRREFPITERFRVQFRCDVFNIANHPNFGPPGTTYNPSATSAFGVVTSTAANYLSANGTAGFNPLYNLGGPRSMQFSLKLMF